MVWCRPVLAGGMFGPMQTVSKASGGLNTAIGYRYTEDKMVSHTDQVFRQNQIYSQAAYGADGIWEIYGRIGIADLKIFDAYRPTDGLTWTSKMNFEENWKFFGTLGVKAFYSINAIFGLGVFVQGSYNFSNLTDDVAGFYGLTPYIVDLKIKHFWDVNAGVGAQASLPGGFKLYGGPYACYAQADGSVSAAIPGIQGGAKNVSFKNKSVAGGYFGADIPLLKGFRLNIEGQYSDRFSIGSAITYVY